MWKEILSGIGSGALGLLGQELSIRNNKRLQRDNLKFREQAAENDFNRQMRLYERQYKDQSPLNIANQLREAGLNPILAAGQGMGGVGGSANASLSTSGGQYQTQTVDATLGLQLAQIANINADTKVKEAQIGGIESGIKLNEAQIKQIASNIDKNEAEITKIGNENEKLKADTEYQKVLTSFQNIKNYVAAGTAETEIQKIGAEYDNIVANTTALLTKADLDESNRKTIEATRSATIENILSVTTANYASAGKAIQETKNIRETTKFIEKYYDNEIRKTTQAGEQIKINKDTLDLELNKYATMKGWKTSDQNFQFLKFGVDSYFEFIGIGAKALSGMK